MFIVTQTGGGSRITISKNEIDGVIITSATCNGNHYWGAMLYANSMLLATLSQGTTSVILKPLSNRCAVDQINLDHN